jgi:flagellar protein FlaG
MTSINATNAASPVENFSVTSDVKTKPAAAVMENAQPEIVDFEKNKQPVKEDVSSDREASHEQIKEAVEKINKSMPNTEAVFGIHDKTNRVTIKIVDKDSKKVIKEFPPEKTLDLIAKAWEMAGILVDEKR